MNERMGESTTNIGFKPEHVGSYGVLPLYENKWSIFMELLLLDAMEIFGPENWAMIATYINSSFSTEEVRDHYYRVYGDHYNDHAYKLKKDGIQPAMLVEAAQNDIYINARKQQTRRINKETRQKNREVGQWIPGMKIVTPAPQPPSRIPQQFGYEKSKRIFTQPFNEQAEVLIVGLKINKNDGKQARSNKMEVLKKYNELIVQRAIVQNEVIEKNLMQCKYRLKKTQLNFNPEDSIGSKKPARRGRKGKNRNEMSEIKQCKNKGQKLFENMERTFQYDLPQRLHFIYTKIKKYDEEGKIKQLLTEYEEKCKQIQKPGDDNNQNQ